jgi:hypothetical protein
MGRNEEQLQSPIGGSVGKNDAFQTKVRQLGTLVGELEESPAERGNNTARELVKLLMEVHGTAIERLLEIAFESGAAGQGIIAKAGEDPIVRQLLLLYSLHPDDMESRVLKALEAAAPRLRKLSSEVELIGIREGVIQVRASTSGHACGSTGKSVTALVEECVYEWAPDLISLEILGTEEEPSSGFVSLESLLGHSLPARALGAQRAEVVGAD